MTAALARTATELRVAAHEARAGWRARHTLTALAVALAAIVPFAAPAGVDIVALARVLHLALAATALALAVHYGGVPSLGHGAFVGIGAFGTALVADRRGWPLLTAVLVGVVAAALAAALAAPALVRLRPALAAAATWLLAWLVWLALNAFPSATGGARGLSVPGPASEALHYELALGGLVLAAALLAALARSTAGAQLSALRQRPAAARALGVRVARLRLPPLVVSAALCGLAGGLAVEADGIADAADYSPFASFELFAAVFIGGAASVIGPTVGAVALAAVDSAAHAYGDIGPLPGERVEPLAASLFLLVVVASELTGFVRRRPARAPASPARAALAPSPVAVRAEGLTKRFAGVVAAESVDLELRSGEIVALVGPNGSGKTTVLRLLAGALAPDAGRVLVDGVDVTGQRERVRLGVVRTLQATALFPELTAFESALAGAGARTRTGAARALLATPQSRRERVEAGAAAAATLARVELADAANTSVRELDAARGRLLMLATALATSPRAVLLDEPAAGASRDDVNRLVELLRGLRDDGLAVLLVEHDLGLVRAVADRVVVLDAGRVLASGTPAEVWSQESVRTTFLGRRSNQ